MDDAQDDILTKFPILRIIIPYTIGIATNDFLCIKSFLAPIYIGIVGLLIYLIPSAIKKIDKYFAYSYLYGIGFFIICLSLGIVANILSAPTSSLPNVKDCVGIGIVTDIKIKDYSTQLDMDLLEVRSKTEAIPLPCKTKIRTNIQASEYNITEGDIIAFAYTPTVIKNLGNPEEFDYKAFMRHKGFAYSNAIERGKYKTIGHKNSILSYSKNIQRSLINNVLNSKLNADTKAFIITILLGDSSLMDQDDRDIISKAGLSHILAVSGLHVGIIFTILSILLLPLDYLKKRNIRLAVTLIAIIAYAFVSGLSSSVVRATIMTACIIITTMAYRQNFSLNALFLSALIILAFNPLAIFDVGFQLSFATVFTILLTMPSPDSISIKNKLLRYSVSSILLSTAAILGSALLCAYYFNYIALYSIIPNIVILPVLPIFLFLCIVFIGLSLLGIHPAIIINCLDFSYNKFMILANYIGQLPGATITQSYLTTFALIAGIAATCAIIYWLHYRKTFGLYLSIITTLFFVATTIIDNKSIDKKGSLIISSYSDTEVLSFNSNNAYLYCPDDTAIDLDNFINKHQRLLSKYKITQIRKTNSYNDSSTFIQHPFAMINGKRYLFASNNYYNRHKNKTKIPLNAIIITKKYYGSISKLMDNFDTKQIIIANDVYAQRKDSIISECRHKGYCYKLFSDASINE